MLDVHTSQTPNMPPKDQNGNLIFTTEEWENFQEKLLLEATGGSDYVLWKSTEKLSKIKTDTAENLLSLLDTAALLAGSDINQGDSLQQILYKLGSAFIDGLDKPSVEMTQNTKWYQDWKASLSEYSATVKNSDFRYFVQNDIAAIEFAQKQKQRIKYIQSQTDFGYNTELKNKYFKQRLLQEVELSIRTNTIERRRARKLWREITRTVATTNPNATQ